MAQVTIASSHTPQPLTGPSGFSSGAETRSHSGWPMAYCCDPVDRARAAQGGGGRRGMCSITSFLFHFFHLCASLSLKISLCKENVKKELLVLFFLPVSSFVLFFDYVGRNPEPCILYGCTPPLNHTLPWTIFLRSHCVCAGFLLSLPGLTG